MGSWQEGSFRLRGSTESAVLRFANHVNSHISAFGLNAENLLDVGAGDGQLTELVASACGSLTVDAVDVSDKYMSADSKKRLNFQKIKSPLRLPYEDNRFSLCISFGVLQYLPSRSLPHLLDELLRVTKPDGAILQCNILDFRKLTYYHPRPFDSLPNLPKFLRHGLRSQRQKKIWQDGSLWHDLGHIFRDNEYDLRILRGYSDERSDILLWKK